MDEPPPPTAPGPKRRAAKDRRAEPSAARRGARPSRSARWLGIAGRDLLLIGGALLAVIAAITLTRPIFANHPTVVQALHEKAPMLTKTILPASDTSRIAQLVKTPQFEADRKAFAADLVKTGRVDPARADSIAYYAVRESYVNGIPPAVVFGVMLTENSRFVSGAMSDVGAVGLMQVYPKIWLKALSAKFGKDLATDSTNLKYGIYILKQYIKSDSGRVTQRDVGKGLLRYNGCVTGSHTANCKTYPNKVKSFVENQADAMCGDKSFYDCIAKPFIAGLMGRQTPASAAAPATTQ
jgi:soluble lytic murein transglycosylase-like protein